MTDCTLREKIETLEIWQGDDGRTSLVSLAAFLALLDAHTAEQPAPDAVAEAAIADDDSLARRISELGWQIHNLGCEYQNDEKLLDRLQDLRGMAWEIADTVREGAA